MEHSTWVNTLLDRLCDGGMKGVLPWNSSILIRRGSTSKGYALTLARFGRSLGTLT